jgi:hypothetical protein
VRAAIEIGDFTGCQDVHCTATLIKIWFRELRPCLLEWISQEDVAKIATATDSVCFSEVLACLPEPNQSLFLWVLDLLAEVSLYSAKNLMPARNLATLFAPNLFSADNIGTDPIAAMDVVTKRSEMVVQCLHWRRQAIEQQC